MMIRNFKKEGDMQNKFPKEWEDAFDLVRHNISDTKYFMLIRRKFNRILLAYRNVDCLFTAFNNAISCATIITFYKAVENGKKKSLPYLLRQAIKTIDEKQYDRYNLGSKVKTLEKIRMRIKSLRDRVWGHALDFRKPTQGKRVQKNINLQEIDSCVNQVEQYFNETIELLESEGYLSSRYKIKSATLKNLEVKIDAFLKPTLSGIKNRKN